MHESEKPLFSWLSRKTPMQLSLRNLLVGLLTVLCLAVFLFLFQHRLLGARKDREFKETYKEVAIFFADDTSMLSDRYSKVLQDELAASGYEVSQSSYPRDVLSTPARWSAIWEEPFLMHEKSFQTHLQKLVLAQVSRADFDEIIDDKQIAVTCEIQVTLKVFLSQPGALISSYTFSKTQSGPDKKQAREAAYAAAVRELERKLVEVVGT